MSRPDSFAGVLRETAFYLDLLDDVLAKVEVTAGNDRLVSTGDEVQRDLRSLADRLPADLDDRLMALLTEVQS